LGTLKGGAMKLGQLLSMQKGVLPEETIQELSQLQRQAPGMHPTLARTQFKSALGKYPEEMFRTFEPEPFAAASLGQVHRAITLKGERVAVKIQYPAIRTSLENDFKLLRSAMLPGRISGHVPVAVLDEIQRGILEETDYLHEADNVDFFRHGLAELEYLKIPRVYRELSSNRVLTMSFIEGETLAEFLKRKPSVAMRELVTVRLREMFEAQTCWLGALHADSHPGNYLFQPDGAIGLVDFGCVKHLSFDISEYFDNFRRRIWREGEAGTRKFFIGVGPEVPYQRLRKMVPLLERLADYYHPNNGETDLVMDYGNSKANAESKKLGMEYGKRLWEDKLYHPEFAFAARADIGFHHLLDEIRRRIVAAAPILPRGKKA
jgi:predicted unusual protein kinase regulating ubiquinone biosynthesis (AarF/ABC1/UbiB family)